MELRHLRLTRFVSAAGAVAAIGLLLSPDPAQAQKGGGGTTPLPNPEIVFTDSGIKVMNADGTNVRTVVPLARGDGANNPCWGPTGTAIVFTGGFSGQAPGIFTVNLDGTNRTKIVTSTGAANPRWSAFAAPTGQKMIAYTDYGPPTPQGTNQRDIFLVNPDGTNRTNLTNTIGTYESDCGWGPDGSTLYITRDYDLVRLTLGLDSSGAIGVVSEEVVWSFNNTPYQPTFANSANSIVLRVSGDPYSRLYEIDFGASSAPDLVTLASTADETNPSYSPDDTKLVFWRGGANGGIFTVKRDGTGEVRINAKGRSPNWKRTPPIGP